MRLLTELIKASITNISVFSILYLSHITFVVRELKLGIYGFDLL